MNSPKASTDSKKSPGSEKPTEFFTRSHIPVKAVYGPEDSAASEQTLGAPASFPFTRGVQKDMYRGRLWTMRQYAGFGTAEESNQRYHYLLSQGTMGLSVAFDLPTQLGYDPDHPRARGEVGKVGVSLSTLDEMRVLFRGIDQSQVSTSMTINATAGILLAFYVALAQEQGVAVRELRGTVQNDVLKEYVARGNYIYPATGTLRLVTDMFAWCQKQTPKWNPISISGYHIREAGSTAVQELAFTFANAIAYLEAAIGQGLSVDEFAGQLSFFFNVHNDFFEEVAKFRAARRIWAKLIRDRFGGKDPRSQMLRFHSQTAGSTLTAQQPNTNVVRVTLQALAAVLGGTQSLHTNSLDEALALPTEASATLALRTQQVIAHESRVTQTVDPLGGSWFVESLTDEIEKKTFEYLKEIDRRGGTIACIESGYIQTEISNSAYGDQKKIDSGELKVVGVNCFKGTQSSSSAPMEILKVPPELEQSAVERIRQYRLKRSFGATKDSLSTLKEGVSSGANLQELILNAVKAGATLGEISDVFRETFGLYQEYSGF
ncbi:MAG: acyl-CoA mutase large subunit family protein [Bdellovibrionia bacterium]